MKVAVLSSNALPSPPVSYGGLEYVAYLHALSLHKMGYDVTLYAVPNPAVDYPFDIVELNSGSESDIDTSDLDKYDVVIDETHSKVWGDICIYHDFMPALGKKCKKHVAVSLYHALSLESIYGINFLFAYDPVDTSWVTPRAKEKLVVYYGRMNKGVNEFLNFFKVEKCSTISNADIAIVGDDSIMGEEDIKKTKKLAEELNAQYYGLVHDRKEVGEILGRAAVVASAFHPFYKEAFGMWAVEAIAAGAVPIAPQESTKEIVSYIISNRPKVRHYLLEEFDTDYTTLRLLLCSSLRAVENGIKLVNKRDAELFEPQRITKEFIEPLLKVTPP